MKKLSLCAVLAVLIVTIMCASFATVKEKPRESQTPANQRIHIQSVSLSDEETQPAKTLTEEDTQRSLDDYNARVEEDWANQAESAPESEPQPYTTPYTEEEVEALAKTLAGECYNNEVQDKRNVAWVVCNRVDDGRFGDGVIGVLSSKSCGVQFSGYWNQSREVNQSDIEIAIEVLSAWLDGNPAPHNYLYFTGGTGKTNNFR